jgi:hypothetical protein
MSPMKHCNGLKDVGSDWVFDRAVLCDGSAGVIDGLVGFGQ